MADTKNLCAQIPLTLHDRVCTEKDQAGLTTAQYITNLLTEYYQMKENGGNMNMANNTITVSDVSLFPQGYAAVLTQPELLDEPSVIVADIGGWTVDLMRLDRRIPNAATCRSLELGMIRCVDEIGEQVRRLFGLSLTAPQIESVLRGDSASMDERVRAVIHAQADKYVRGLLSAITESGLDVRAMPTVFLGGGAALMKRHGGAVEGLFRPFILDDVCLNAKGYERLVAQMSRGERRERDG